MQKYLFFLLLSPFLFACNSASKSEDAEQKKILTVTIDPQRYFLDQIVGDQFTINTLVPNGTSPETYEPAPSVMIDMAKSHLYFRVGELGFEKAWSERLVENNSNLIIVDCSEGIEPLEGHLHTGDDGDAHLSEATDPHVWLSPKTAKIFTRNMLDAVVKADPDQEELYRTNFDELTARIDTTDMLIRNMLKDASAKSFIIYHPALSYFANDYGLHQYSIEFEGKNPSPAQIKRLVDVAGKEKINTVFIQRGFDAKNAEVIAKEIGAEVFEIDPLSYDWDQELIRIASILSREADKGRTDEQTD